MEDKNLYHYTSIESLAMILKNKNIRFSPLTNLDDTQEERTIEPRNYGKYVFVSSWTDDSNESIPMWKMYTDIKSGVRIRLRRQPFKTYETNKSLFPERINGVEIQSRIEDDASIDFVPTEELTHKKNTLVTSSPNTLLKKVEYTSDIDKLVPKIEDFTNEKKSGILLNRLGIYKNEYWKFQSEWRYVIKFVPTSIDKMMADLISGKSNPLKSMLNGFDLPFKYYFLNIDDSSFQEMEITLSPLLTDGNRVLAESLIEKYNPTATLSESKLRGLMRF